MDEGKYVVNVEVAVVREGRYLVMIRSDEEEYTAGVLAFPDGKVDPATVTQDVLEERARREVLEETGLTVTHLEYLEITSFQASDGMYVVDVVFLAAFKEGEAVAGDPSEVDEFLWLAAEEVLAHDRTPAWLVASAKKAELAHATVNADYRQGGIDGSPFRLPSAT